MAFKPTDLKPDLASKATKKPAAKPGQVSDTAKKPSRQDTGKKAVKKSKSGFSSSEQKEILEVERVFRKGAVSILDIIAPSALKVNSDHLKLGTKFVRTVFVVSYPRYVSVGWFAPVINYSVNLDVSMFFYPIPSHLILKQLKKKVGIIEAQIIADAEKGSPRDPIRETALRDIEQLRDSLSQGIEKFFQYALYITLYADTMEELDKNTEKIELMFGSKLVYTRRVFYQAEQGLNSTLPMANDELQITFNMNSSPCASSFPFMSADLSSDNGVLYGINRHNNSLVLFDRFSMQNYNMTIFATSGAGKSYTVKLEILRSLMMGTEVIVIDPEMEYKHLSDSVGGTFVNISLSSDNKINPFDLPRPKGQEVKTADIIRSAVITLKGLLKIMLGDFTHTEDSLLDRALLETYAKKDITPDTDLTKVEAPLMKDLEDILEGMVGGENLALRLSKYTKGTFAGLINNPTNVEMDNTLVVFSVRDLEDELRPIAIYTIVNYIWNVVRSELKRRILAIDEAWWLMQNDDSAKFIYALVKRCRKYYLGVTTITQDVNDFLRSVYGQAILNNSSLRLLLKQSSSAIDVVQKTFMLTQGEKYLLLESGVGSGIFFAGSKHAAIQIVASAMEDQVITSDPQQLLAIAEAKRRFQEESMEEGGVAPTEAKPNKDDIIEMEI